MQQYPDPYGRPPPAYDPRQPGYYPAPASRPGSAPTRRTPAARTPGPAPTAGHPGPTTRAGPERTPAGRPGPRNRLGPRPRPGRTRPSSPDRTRSEAATRTRPRQGLLAAVATARGAVETNAGVAWPAWWSWPVLVGGLGTRRLLRLRLLPVATSPRRPTTPATGSGDAEVKIPEGATLAEMAALLQRPASSSPAARSSRRPRPTSKALGIKRRDLQPAQEDVGCRRDHDDARPGEPERPDHPRGHARQADLPAHRQGSSDEPEGTTAKTAKHADLGLPGSAGGNPEGCSSPRATPSVRTPTRPTSCAKMVKRAKAEYAKIDLEAQAQEGRPDPARSASPSPPSSRPKPSSPRTSARSHGSSPTGSTKKMLPRLRLDHQLRQGPFDAGHLDRATPSSTRPTTPTTHRGLPPGPIDSPGRPGHPGRAASRPTATGCTSSPSNPATPGSPTVQPNTTQRQGLQPGTGKQKKNGG